MDIVKNMVIGFLVTKVPYRQPKRGEPAHFITARPLAIDWEGIDEEHPLEEGEEVVAVIPAPPGSYEVWGFQPGGKGQVLGYEFPGAYAPDWNKVLKGGA